MKYCAFFSLILLSSSFVVSKQEDCQPEYKLAQLQEQSEQPSLLDIEVQLPCNEATKELIKAMKELWDTVHYEPDATITSLLDEQAEFYSSLAMERALEVSCDLLEKHRETIPQNIRGAFNRSLEELIMCSKDFDGDFDCEFACDSDMRCSCGEPDPDAITQAYFNS